MKTTIYIKFHGGRVTIIGGNTTGFLYFHLGGGGVVFLGFLSFLCVLLTSLLSSVFRFGPILLHCISFDIPAGFQEWVLDIVFGWTFSCCFLFFFSFFSFFSLGLYGVGFGFRDCKKTQKGTAKDEGM